jgi:outer membrane receptor for ferrienterochelin and colicins
MQVTDKAALDEVVVSGTLKEISRSESAVPVEILTPKLFQKNPTPSLFEAVGMINGVQPQLNCNVCNTGDIHINGMEGPYTMILIDGMPIVSALSTVYGLSGIPNSLVERIEIVKGPASSLYGSEAMGGIINVITKNPSRAPLVSVDVFATGWGEYSADAAVKMKIGAATSLLGLNYYNYQQPIDKNGDGFTDVTLQNRISLFNKWGLARKGGRIASLAARYVYEDRWGGQMGWNQEERGGNNVYGESIYTNRAELIGMYQLPVKEKIFTQWSYNWHDQNSYYGTTPYMARQEVAFGQAYWDKTLAGGHNTLLGASYRYTRYDDNTPATASLDGLRNAPTTTPLPGVFIQDDWRINRRHRLLAGYRFDYDKHHGPVHSPRIAYKFSPDAWHTFRASFGTGYRVVNLFTEDHAALTGAREVIIREELNPERSYNGNLNYVLKMPTDRAMLGIDATAFYSYFPNRITGDFDTDPNKIIYDNLKGHAVSRGISLNTDIAAHRIPLKLLAGVTYADVYQVENDAAGTAQKQQQLHAPVWSGTFAATYVLFKKLTVDFTGKWNGPMRLPILPNDYRPEYSPTFCIANIQLTQKIGKSLEVYGGIKNLFDFVPADPIMRAFDPFDKTAGDAVSNPNGYTFDPGYNYSSMQGIRGFAGLRYSIQ